MSACSSELRAHMTLKPAWLVADGYQRPVCSRCIPANLLPGLCVKTTTTRERTPVALVHHYLFYMPTTATRLCHPSTSPTATAIAS